MATPSVALIADLTAGESASAGIIGGILALIIAVVFVVQVRAKDRGGEAMKKIGDLVHNGAKDFLNTEYKFLTVFVVIMAVVIGLLIPADEEELAGLYTVVCFLVGAILSAAAGYLGMAIATVANTRTAKACQMDGLSGGLSVAFRSGAIMALTVTGFGILGITLLYLIFETDPKVWSYLSGFGFGASSIALFARVAGGIFTKAADVGADLVGKVEAGIPEDDPRNPGVIADNVGDNVGDVAGMGADLFESYVGSLIACGSLAYVAGDAAATQARIALPFWIAGVGIFCSFIGILLVINFPGVAKGATLDKLLWVIRYGIFLAGILILIATIIFTQALFESTTAWELFTCVLIGLVAGIIVGMFTEWVTSYEYRPTQSIYEAAAKGGPATVIIRGLGVGMLSVTVPTISLAATVVACNELSGLYGIALAAVGMLSTLGITLATDAYGPVADNAGGIAEMVPEAELPAETRELTDTLDSLGNTTAATGKGFAIGSAVLTSVGLIAAFLKDAGLEHTSINLSNPVVITGGLIGAMMPFVFAALTMLSVGASAEAVIAEVRRQFRALPLLKAELSEDGFLMDAEGQLLKDATGQNMTPVSNFPPVNGEQLPNYTRCIAICTSSAVEEMIIPGVLAVFMPAVVGFLLGTWGLTGMLVGSLTSGFMLAITMANAGGAWDNAKKWCEKHKKQLKAEGTYEELHDAVVVGDTVGDPFKDTSGPALNILIKLMSVVSLVLAGALRKHEAGLAPMHAGKGLDAEGSLIGIILLMIITIVCLLANIWKRRSAAARAASLAELNAKNDAAIAAAGAGAGAGVAAGQPVEAEKPAPKEDDAAGVAAAAEDDAKVDEAEAAPEAAAEADAEADAPAQDEAAKEPAKADDGAAAVDDVQIEA